MTTPVSSTAYEPATVWAVGRPLRARSRRGSVLLATTVMGVLLMGIWLLAWRGTHDAIRAEGFSVRRSLRDASVVEALAVGLARLETGFPPSDPYQAVYTVVGAVQEHACKLRYTQVGVGSSSESWNVVSTLASDEDLVDLPTLPGTFADPVDPGPKLRKAFEDGKAFVPSKPLPGGH